MAMEYETYKTTLSLVLELQILSHIRIFSQVTVLYLAPGVTIIYLESQSS